MLVLTSMSRRSTGDPRAKRTVSRGSAEQSVDIDDDESRGLHDIGVKSGEKVLATNLTGLIDRAPPAS